jgi:hypothetical protein
MTSGDCGGHGSKQVGRVEFNDPTFRPDPTFWPVVRIARPAEPREPISSHDHGNCALCDEIEARLAALEAVARAAQDFIEKDTAYRLMDEPICSHGSMEEHNAAVDAAADALVLLNNLSLAALAAARRGEGA